MRPRRLPNGNLLVPVPLRGTPGGPDEGMIGDGMVEVPPGSAQYEAWLPYLPEEER